MCEKSIIESNVVSEEWNSDYTDTCFIAQDDDTETMTTLSDEIKVKLSLHIGWLID